MTYAAGEDERLTGHPARFIGCEENRGGTDVLRLPNAAERRLGFDHFPEVTFLQAGRFESLCLHHSRIEGVDTNLLWSQFLGQGDGDRIHRRFGSAVDGSLLDRHEADNGT